MSHVSGLNQAQEEAVRHTNGPLLILAGAGAGKTRVIVERIARLIRDGVPPEKILAVTFTNKAANEMKDRVRTRISNDLALSPYDHLPKHPALQSVERTAYGGFSRHDPFIGTFHRLSLSIIKAFHGSVGLPLKFTIYDRSDSMRAIKEAIQSAGFDPKQLEPRRALSAISKKKGDAITRDDFRENYAASYIDEAIAEVWERYEKILKKEKALDFDDLLLTARNILKDDASAREHFQNAWDYVHVDEYQDTNRVQYEIVRLLSSKHGNVSVVGDVDQCLIKGTKITMGDGSLKAIEDIRVGDVVRSNYGSGDMRPAKVTRIHSPTHRGELIAITSASGKILTSTPEHMHFAGYRLGETPQQYLTYLMYKRKMGWRLGVSQIYTRGQKKSVIGFIQRSNQEHADALWVVGTHKTQQEARIHEYTLSLKYQIPTLPFVARKGLSTNGYVHDQGVLRAIFTSFNTETCAQKLLNDVGMSPLYPHHRAQSRNSNRRNVTLTLCGDRRGKSPMHRIAMVGNDAEGRRALETLGLSVRSAKSNSQSWRFETARKDYAELLAVLKKIQRAFPDIVVIQNARLGGKKNTLRDGNSLPLLPATSLLPGMALFNEEGGFDIITDVQRKKTTLKRVYDLDIERTHNFIANGIVTHNCIYSWRGASIEHIMNFERDFPDAQILLLAENYRSTKTIIAAANDAISKNVNRRDKELYTKNEDGEKIGLAGFADENDEAAFIAETARQEIGKGLSPDDIAVLYRANFQSRVLEEAFLKRNVPYQVLGTRFFERREVKDALSYLKSALNPDSAADFTRAIATPPRGIGKVTLAKIINHQEETLPASAREKVFLFRSTLSRILHAINTQKASEAVRTALSESGMWRAYEHGDSEDAERLENLKELVTVATKYDALPASEGIERLIEEAVLQSDQDELEEKKEGVKLMTVHAAKGLEFHTVFITGLEEGLFPHERDESEVVDTEEERRLFYVALTRAKRRVYATYAITRRIFGTRLENMPSVFITELDSALAEVVTFPLFQEELDTIE